MIPADSGPDIPCQFYGEGPAAVVIGPAMGVPQRFYRGFAAYLAETHGVTVVTFDYEGVGEAAPDDLRRCSATMESWARRDLDGVLAHVLQGHAKVALVAHSVTAQLVPLAPSSRRLCGAAFVATGSGATSLYQGNWRLRIWALWNIVVPFFTATVGYLPMSLVAGEDVPKGVARDWARFGKLPDYLFSVFPKVADELAFPILALTFDQDNYVPAPTIEHLLAQYTQCPHDHQHLGGQDHFSFFRARGQELWPMVGDWLEQQIAK